MSTTANGAPGEGFVSGVVGNSLDPVSGARWNLRYVVPGLTALGARPFYPSAS